MDAYSNSKVLTFYHEAQECLDTGLCKPRNALIYPSRACNQNCYYCADGDTNEDLKHRIMNTKLFLSLPQQVKSLGCEAIDLCGGGEPFLHPHIEEFILLASEFNLKLGALTNGTMLYGNLADLVLKTFSFVRISLDSFNLDTYNKVRRPKNHNVSLEKVIENIKYLVSKKKEINSNLIITIKAAFDKDTILDLEEFIETGIVLGVDGIHIKTAKNTDNVITKERVKNYEFTLNAYKKDNKNHKTQVFGSLEDSVLETPKCFVSPFHVFIDTDGSIRLCCYYQDRQEEHTIGNIHNDSLRNIWWSEIHKEKIKNIDVSKCSVYDCKFHKYNKVLWDGIIKDQGQWQFT